MDLTRQQKMMVAVILSGALLVVLNMTMLSPALPHIMRDTGVDATTVQWLCPKNSYVSKSGVRLFPYYLLVYIMPPLYKL